MVVGVAAKTLGLGNQIFSVVFISSTLGEIGLRQQFLAISLVSWFNLTLVGMHTGLPATLIRCGSDTKAFASFAKTAFALASIGAFCSVSICALIGGYFNHNDVPSSTLVGAVVINAAVVLFSLSERVMQALGKIAEFNLLNALGTIISLSVTYALFKVHGNATEFVLAYYLGVLFPALVAVFICAPYLRLREGLRRKEFAARSRELINVSNFGLGFEVSSYCKLQAPSVVLGALSFGDAIAPVGLGLRLTNLAGSGMAILYPILFLRVGTALRDRDHVAYRRWLLFGMGCAGLVGFGLAVICLTFGQTLFRFWSVGAVELNMPTTYALAIFSGLYIVENTLFITAAPDPKVAARMRWLFWLEGPLAIASGLVTSLFAPVQLRGAGMLAGIAVLIGFVAIRLLLLLRHEFSSRQ